MDIDNQKIDDAVLALMYLNRFTMQKDGEWRAWKGFDWDAMDRLHEQGFVSNPASKSKSVAFSDEGLERAEKLFQKLFAKES